MNLNKKIVTTKEFSKQPKKSNKIVPIDGLCSNIELLAIKNELELNAIQEKQKEMLRDAKNEKILKEKRKKELYQMQNDLRKKFLETNDFIRQCEQKESDAEKQIQNEKIIQNQIKEEIEKYKNNIDDLRKFKKILENTVKELEPYETVMEEIVKKLDGVKSVKECMDRCDALLLAQDEITDAEKTKLKEIDKMRHQMIKATNEASLTILGLNNELAQLEHLYDAAKTECMKWEKILAETKNVIISNEFKTLKCTKAINHMYQLLCKRNGWDHTKYWNNIEKQLDVIKSEIEILQEVVRLCEEAK